MRIDESGFGSISTLTLADRVRYMIHALHCAIDQLPPGLAMDSSSCLGLCKALNRLLESDIWALLPRACSHVSRVALALLTQFGHTKTLTM